MQTIVTEGGEPVPEAHARGVQWLEVAFLGGMRIAWNWNDLLQDATKAGENLNLAMAGLVLSNDVEFTAHRGETVMRQLGFDEIKANIIFSPRKPRTKSAIPPEASVISCLKRKGKPIMYSAPFSRAPQRWRIASRTSKRFWTGFTQVGATVPIL